ncbi:MAG: transposase [bacterium]
MLRKSIFTEGEYYHLYNRGTEKRNIFSLQKDYERFVALLYLSNSAESIHIDNLNRGERGETLLTKAVDIGRGETLVDLGAYVLMPNHFHLLVKEKTTGGISKFMQKLTTGYTMYFNKRHERTGALFQGVFKSTHASEDRYLKYLISYIHLNPIKLIEPKWKETGVTNHAKAEQYLQTYHYSSYLDYAGQVREENNIINKTSLPNYFEKTTDFNSHIADWLKYTD